MAREKTTESPTPRRRPTKRPSSIDLLRRARRQFEELTDVEVECVSGMERTEDGWTVTLETMELRRVPDTVSLLATYVAETDHSGSLTSYRRVNRYIRGRADGR